MRIERLELIGFKSFADKMVFKFHPGTTAIVGPNGCGKSNVVDAFKWVLGEQSAKSLRGGKMEDVIFAGSATKKTKGMAEVTLVLSDVIIKKTEEDHGSNGSGESDTNGAENNGSEDNGSHKSIREEKVKISVTRRLYRSGESEYLMNKVPCRLKDIRNMFLDTGLELKAYSILEQGRIGDIVNSKPQDRRFLIEEVAGVMKYKVRKHEATNKMELAKTNLQRISDIVAEVKRQINTIDRHARKAERYKKLFDEIKDIDIRIAKRNFINFTNEIAGLVSSEETMKSKEAEFSASVHSTEAMVEEKKRLCVEHERSLAQIRTNLYAIERETTEDEGKIALLKNECENLKERLGDLSRQDRELDTLKETTTVSISEIENSEVEMAEVMSRLESALEEKRVVFSRVESEILEMENDLEYQRRSLFAKAEEISNIKNEINHINLNIENISKKTEKSSQDIDSIKDNLSSLNSNIDTTRNEHVEVERELLSAKNSKEEFVSQLRGRKQELADNEETLYREREVLAGLNSKLESLKEIDRSQMASVDENIKTLCQVADIFETPREYERAIEAVLGDKLGAAVVEDKNEITRALQVIREQNTKRSGFIAVNPFGGVHPTSSDSGFEGQPGVIGKATKYVSVKDGYDKVALSLLSDVVLVENLDAALSLWEMPQFADNGQEAYFVTLEGEVLEPSGMVFGGTDKGVLKVKRLIKELEQDLSTKREIIANAERAVSNLKGNIVTIENELISVDARISSQEKYCHELKVKVDNLVEENSRLQKKHEYISLEINDDHREKDSLNSALQEKTALSAERETEKQQIEEMIRSVQNVMTEKRESLESSRNDLTEVKLELTSTNERMSAIKRETDRMKATILDADRRKEEMVNERTNINNAITSKEQGVIDMESALKVKVIKASEFQSEASRVNEILESKTAELAIIEKREKEIASELESVRNELNHVEMKKMEKSMKLDYMKEDIHKTYSIEIATAEVSDVVELAEEEIIPQLKEKLQSMGAVSLGTIDEYEELKERYDFLITQRDDLLQSIEALEDTIRKINRTSKKKLEEAFELLNTKFKEVFSILFGKGRAELQLTEGSILDAGIEIIAQPPGKRLQNLNLLSGGEKALTAISLLFAGFMIKPTPMCLLDEVDAPLDESNTGRFVDLVKSLEKNIQFITITHNRRTMEAADYIYGITMQEPGSSRGISMHMTDVATDVEVSAEAV